MNRLYSLPKPVIFAHRGASLYAPENTLAAFELAAQQGADAIELDVKLSADGEVVVIHDQTVDRTTDGIGKVNHLTLEQLKILDAGAKFSTDFSGEPIPTLREVFEHLGGRLYINVELTNYNSTFDDLPRKVAAIVRDCGQEDNVLFSSFNLFNLLKMKKYLPNNPVAALASSGFLGFAQRGQPGKLISPEIIHPNIKDVSLDYIKSQKVKNRRVHVWTVNDPQEMKRLSELGADGIFTDDPQTAVNLLRQG